MLAGALPGVRRRAHRRATGRAAASAFGSRLQAAVATLAVRNRVSRRDTVELCEELFGARISAGSVDRILQRTGDALERPYADLVRRAQRSSHLERR